MIRLVDDRASEAGMDGLFWLRTPPRLDLSAQCSTAVALRLMVRERVAPSSGRDEEPRDTDLSSAGGGA